MCVSTAIRLKWTAYLPLGLVGVLLLPLGLDVFGCGGFGHCAVGVELVIGVGEVETRIKREGKGRVVSRARGRKGQRVLL